MQYNSIPRIPEEVEGIYPRSNAWHLPRDFYAIEARTKDLDSFVAKVDLPEKEQKYQDIAEVTDLSGIRIICYLDEDAIRVA